MAGITDLLVEGLGKRPEHVHVVIQEVAEENWGFCGKLTDDLKQSRPETGSEWFLRHVEE